MLRYCFFFLLFCLYNQASGQTIDKVSLNFRYGIDLPGFDLAKRFGESYNPELGLQANKNNWFYGIHGGMFLGPVVKEDVISNIRNKDGLLVSQQQDFAVITMKQRGFSVGLNVGKFIPLIENFGSHGIRVRAGANVFTHYIIFNNETASSNQLLGDYARGYDRLSRGFGIEQFIGYQFTSASGSVSLFAGINSIQASTVNLRPYNFDTRERDATRRFDMLTGFRAGITINLYEFSEAEEVFY